MQLQVLVDFNGQSLAEADQLVDVLLEGNLSDLMGTAASFVEEGSSSSQVSIRFYVEAPSSGALIEVGDGAVFNNNWNNVSAALGISYLLANAQKPEHVLPSTRILELAAEIVSTWPLAHADTDAIQALIIVTPNEFVTDQGQWDQFADAVRQSMVLPIFLSTSEYLDGLPTAPWVPIVSSLWQQSFPDFPTLPIAIVNRTADDLWKNFSIADAVEKARDLVSSSGASPVVISSESSLDLTLVSDTLINSGTERKLTFNLALNASANPSSPPSKYTAGIVGISTGFTFTTSLSPVPFSSNAKITIQRADAPTTIMIPIATGAVEDGSATVVIQTLPTQGKLSLPNGGAQITTVPFVAPSSNFTYLPNPTRTSSDSFTHIIRLACGDYGPFTNTLNLTFVPQPPVITQNKTFTLTEDDMTPIIVDLSQYVTSTNANTEIVLLALTNMAGSLNRTSTGEAAALGVRYPISDASFKFELYRPGRGPFNINITYVVDNGLGAIATGVVFFTITDTQHAPNMYSQVASTTEMNFIALNDIDGDSVTVSVTSGSSQIQICLWNISAPPGTQPTCGTTSQTFSNLPVPAMISVQFLVSLVNLDTQYTVKVWDASSVANPSTRVFTMTPPLLSLGPVVDLLFSVLNIVAGLVGGEIDQGSTRIDFQTGAPNGSTPDKCYFPVAPSSANLLWLGATNVMLNMMNPFAWSNFAQHFADYKPYAGVSGTDFFFFQCTYLLDSSSTNSAQFFIYQIPIPIPKPSASKLTLDKDPFAQSVWIPIQGLISKGALTLSAISSNSTSSLWQVLPGGILYFPGSPTSSLTYTLCSVANSTLCTSPIVNVVNSILPLPVLSQATQSFQAQLNGTLNTFQLSLPSDADGIVVQSLGLVRSGTVTINSVVLAPSAVGTFIPTTGSFTFVVHTPVPVTADLLSIFSFTFVAVARGYPSQPGTVYILPKTSDLVSLLPPVSEAVNTLTSTLTDTLTIASTLLPGFRTELDVFGKRTGQSLYASVRASLDEQLALQQRKKRSDTLGGTLLRAEKLYQIGSGSQEEREMSQEISRTSLGTRRSLVRSNAEQLSPPGAPEVQEDIVLSAVITAPPSGKLEVCDGVTFACRVIPPGTNVTVKYVDSVFLTPPLLTSLVEALGRIVWTVTVDVVDPIAPLSRIITSVGGSVELLGDSTSDQLRTNVLQNVAPALERNVPGVARMLAAAGLDPEGCDAQPLPSPLVCYENSYIANGTVTVKRTLTIGVPKTLIFDGNLNVTSTGTVQLAYVELNSVALSFLPFVNVSGNIYAQNGGEIVIDVTEDELERIVFAHTKRGTRQAYFDDYYSELKRQSEAKALQENEKIENAGEFNKNEVKFNSNLNGRIGKRQSVPEEPPAQPPTLAPESAPTTTPSNNYLTSAPKRVMEAQTIYAPEPPLTLRMPTTGTSDCYSATSKVEETGGRQTMVVLFQFNQGDPKCIPPPSGENLVGLRPSSPAYQRRLQWILIGVFTGLAVLLIVTTIIIFLVFKYNKAANRVARPYSVKRTKGTVYRTQPSAGSADTASYGSTEMLVPEGSSPRGYADGIDVTSAEMGSVEQEYPEDEDILEPESDDSAGEDHTEDGVLKRA